MTLFVTTHYMDEAERCSHVGYIYMGKLIVCGVPDDLKKMPEVSPPGTRRLDVTCDHITQALQAMRGVPGVKSATVFGQSMHLLVDERCAAPRLTKSFRALASGTPRSTRSDRRWKMFSLRSLRSTRMIINRSAQRNAFVILSRADGEGPHDRSEKLLLIYDDKSQ